MVRLRQKNLMENEKEIVSLNPRKLVTHFYEKVDVSTAAIVIFISIFLESLLLLFLKLPRIIEYFTITLIINFIFSWIVLGAILYVLLYLVKGKSNLKGNEYKKILSGLASFRVVSIFSLLVVVLMVLIFMPSVLPFISMFFQNPALFLAQGYLPTIGLWGGIGIFLLIIFGISICVYYLIMFYHFVKNMYNFKNNSLNLLMTLLILIIMVLFSTII
jgi:hypothetical protein